ncbi:sigma-70 family RNA polymerase sigma factor [Actinoplanes sp. NPDC024001]|uniref:RNA polymerase sigma factor n=1 Tax=Actinoplanes sp. NPDC024001 TaxID=3154598 RepID=UPI0034119C4B
MAGSSPQEEEFNRLWREHAAAVLRYARRRVTEEQADEVVAETFVVAWRRQVEVPAAALPWLLGVARRVSANLRRSDRRRDALHERLVEGTRPQDLVAPAAGESGGVTRALDRLPGRAGGWAYAGVAADGLVRGRVSVVGPARGIATDPGISPDPGTVDGRTAQLFTGLQPNTYSWLWSDDDGRQCYATVTGYPLDRARAAMAAVGTDGDEVTWRAGAAPGLRVLHRRTGAPYPQVTRSESWLLLLTDGERDRNIAVDTGRSRPLDSGPPSACGSSRRPGGRCCSAASASRGRRIRTGSTTNRCRGRRRRPTPSGMTTRCANSSPACARSPRTIRASTATPNSH